MTDELMDEKLEKIHSRLKFLRSLSGLTRGAIEKKHKLPEITLRSWETCNVSITERGITRCLEIYRKEGINVTEKWIKEGTGTLPSYFLSLDEKKRNSDKDLNYFRGTYKNCIIYEVNDDDMFPYYNTGDYIIGFAYSGDIQKLHNKNCLVILENNEILLKRALVSSNNDIYFTSINRSQNSSLLKIKFQFLASIVWHRIKEE